MEAWINRPGFRFVTANSLRFTTICICQYLSLGFASLGLTSFRLVCDDIKC